MTAVAITSPRKPLTPAPILALLVAAVLGCAVGAVALIATAPAAALLTVAVLVLAGWLVHLAATMPLRWLLATAALGVLVAACPWLLLLAVLACLALTRGGPR